jgi:hypothetical protein
VTGPSDFGLRTLPLGFAPATGRASVDQVLRFKQLLRDKLKQRDPDGVWLETVTDGERRGVQVVYDPEIAGAEQYATRALQASAGAWEKVAKQCRERTPA